MQIWCSAITNELQSSRLVVEVRGIGTGGGGGGHMSTSIFFKGPKVPFFVIKSALCVQVNVAINTIFVEGALLFGNFKVF